MNEREQTGKSERPNASGTTGGGGAGFVKCNVRPHVRGIKYFGEFVIRRIISNFFVQGKTLNHNFQALCEK
jgi:hypothetical protein